MMDFDKMKELAEGVSDSLPICDIEDIFFMVRAMSQALDVVRDNATSDGLEAVEFCDDLLEDFMREINQRTMGRTAIIKSSEKITNTLVNLNVLSAVTLDQLHDLCEQIHASVADDYSKTTMVDGSLLIETEMIKRNLHYLPIGVDRYTVADVPTPDEIINGRPPDDIPNN